MKSPQLANGYTPIANELLEGLICYKFTQNDYKVLLAIIRKTYGYHKKWDAIGNSQLATMTGLQRTHVARSIRSLIAQNVLITDDSQYKNTLGINKHYQNWGKTNIETPQPKTDPQTVTNLVIVPELNCDQVGLDDVTNVVILNNQNCDHIGHTQKKVKESINKTPLLLSNAPINGTAKNGLSRGGFINGMSGAEQSPAADNALIFPKSLSEVETKAALQLLVHCSDSSQALLDVVAATIKAGKVQTSPLALLGALIRRQTAGTFDPSPGLKIKLDRERVIITQKKVPPSLPIDKEAQRQNMANFLSATNIRLSKH